MDNYKLDEVKNIIDKNLLSPDVLKNILKSTTRRIETYQDSDAIEILKYLSNNDVVPNETKEEINKYLAQNENYDIENKIDYDNSKNQRKINIIIMFLIIIILVIISFIVLKNN